MPPSKLPITAIVATKNEERRIGRCLEALQDFGQIIVQDSNSRDRTTTLAKLYGAQVESFTWNGLYPKKRQSALTTMATPILNDWVAFIDADEIATPALIKVLKQTLSKPDIDQYCGFFIQGQYIIGGKPLRFGMRNNKLALIRKSQMEFPTIDDLDISPETLGELEGHYQPIKKPAYKHQKIGQIKAPLLHDACDDLQAWEKRHKRYAKWEDAMTAKNAWPREDSPIRQTLKTLFRAIPPKYKAPIAFAYSYYFKLGFLDGNRGKLFANLRAQYYKR